MLGHENFNNKKFNANEFDLIYGTDGFLYAQDKFSGEIFVFVNGQWEGLDDVWDLMQSVPEYFPENFVDNQENFLDDY